MRDTSVSEKVHTFCRQALGTRTTIDNFMDELRELVGREYSVGVVFVERDETKFSWNVHIVPYLPGEDEIVIRVDSSSVPVALLSLDEINIDTIGYLERRSD